MLRLRSAIFKLVFYIWGTFLCLVWLPVLYIPGMPRRWLVKFQVILSRSMGFWLKYIMGLKMEVRGSDHIAKSPVIYAMKHQSMLDTFIMHSIVPDPTFILKKELLKIPLYGRLCKGAGNIPIDRDMGLKSMKEMLRRSAEETKNGRPIIIFPEGSRAAPGEKHPYMSGIFGIYKHLKVPVVPIAVNTGLYWPQKGDLKRGTYVIEFLDPIEHGLKKAEFMEQLEQVIEGASQKLLAA